MPPLNVLVADDEEKIAKLLEQVLVARGCSVRLAKDGLDALSQFKEKSAEVVITDIKMPKMNGIELLRELKNIDPLLNIVVITAYPSIEGAVEAMQCGACDFITKPFDIHQIQAILYRCSQRVSLTRQLRHAGEGSIKLEELNRRLVELNDLKSQFLGTISHEINTPLCLMSEWLYLMSEGSLGQLKPEQESAIGVLCNAYERLHRLLQQLIDLMHGHTIVLQRRAVNVQEVVHEALAIIKPKAEARSLMLNTKLPSGDLPLDIDRRRFVSAISFLLDNAVKFNREQGRIDIEVVGETERVYIRIQDTGVGIPPDEQEKVFTPFYQVDRRLNRAYEGAGVGLTLAKRYVELHGGSIQLSSEIDVGTTVTIAIPRPAMAMSMPDSESSAL